MTSTVTAARVREEFTAGLLRSACRWRDLSLTNPGNQNPGVVYLRRVARCLMRNSARAWRASK